MFTGIVGAVGRLVNRELRDGDARLEIDSADLGLQDVQLGDSIAVNGICLTVTDLAGSRFCADVSLQTLQHSYLGQLPPGSPLNLEKALMPTSRLGGHIVTGHVDGLGTIVDIRPEGRARCLEVRAAAGIARYIARKGSIAVDGISLTVNAVQGDRFELAVIPHTQEHTTLMGCSVGQQVHLEVDILARYIERLLRHDSDHKPEGLSLDTLTQHGYLA